MRGHASRPLSKSPRCRSRSLSAPCPRSALAPSRAEILKLLLIDRPKTTENTCMEQDKDPYVWVRRQWNGQDSAKVRLEHLHSPRWDITSGGVRAPAPQYFLYGYISCDSVIEGDLAHSCSHGNRPHSIKVCIVRELSAMLRRAISGKKITLWTTIMSLPHGRSGTVND